MAKPWDEDMQDRFEKLTISLDEKFELIDLKFESIDEKFESIDRRFDGIDKRLDGVDNRFDDVLRAIKMERQHTHEMIAKAAEGYGATLERIERILQETQRNWQDKFTLHDHALTDHAGRLVALERRKKP